MKLSYLPFHSEKENCGLAPGEKCEIFIELPGGKMIDLSFGPEDIGAYDEATMGSLNLDVFSDTGVRVTSIPAIALASHLLLPKTMTLKFKITRGHSSNSTTLHYQIFSFALSF